MATIEHLRGEDREKLVREAIAAFAAMQPATLIAQQVLLNGALDALQNLLARGCTPDNARLMQNDVLLTLGMVHGVAAKRGIKLPKFQEPHAPSLKRGVH